MPRVFIGLALPADVAEPLAARAGAALAGAANALRLYPARDLHLTLCFVGELERAAELGRALVDETRHLAAPELSLGLTGAFPDAGSPRVLWAGVREAPGTDGRLDALRNRAITAAQRTGWRMPASELVRPFRPHVTLARVREGHGGVQAAVEVFLGLRPRGAWLASEVALFSSDPGRPESRYAVVVEAPLAVRPG